MRMTERVRQFVKDFLQINEAPKGAFLIEEKFDFESNAFKNRIWYRGEANEIASFYRQAALETCPFWGAHGTRGLNIRKIHTGLPRIIANTVADITVADMSQVVIEDKVLAETWTEIAQENRFNKLVNKAVKDALVIGDGAFKISIDSSVSRYPIIEFYSGDRIDIERVRGRVNEVVFKSRYEHRKRTYVLNEHYGRGYVRYKLYRDDAQVSLASIPQTERLGDVEWRGDFMLAVPFAIYESDKHPGRGQSIYDGKCDNFDVLDEAWSQWIDALRAGRAKTYIPKGLIPRDEHTGALLKPNPYVNQFIAIESNMDEGVKNQIEVVQPNIPTDSYVQTYITALDLCLQGLISPSTLGIDVKKLDNAEAQREKEKTTLYTRQSVVDALADVVPRVVNASLNAQLTSQGKSAQTIECSVEFGEYASPSFEAVVETLSNPNTPMSIEARVEEMWGDSRTQEWKEREVALIKAQSGVAMAEEPALEQGASAEPTEVNEVIDETIAKTLNGAQTQSLINIVMQYKSGVLSENQALQIISTSIGVPVDQARALLAEA